MTRSAFITAALVPVIALAAPAVAAPLPVALDPGVTRGPVAAHGTTRAAITVAPPSSFRSTVDTVPAGARLLTAIAVPEAVSGQPLAPLRFRVSLEGDGASTTLYDRVLDGSDARDRRWVDVGIALDPFAGRSGTLRFETAPAHAAPAGVPAGWWAPPELVPCADDTLSLLLITIDALRADHLGSAGYARATTPSLDAFASDATRFAAAFAGGPKTIPSIPQILTGTYFYWHRPTRSLVDLLGPDDMPSHAIVNNPHVAGWLRGAQPGFDSVHAGELDARAITSAALRYLSAAGRCPTALYLHYLDTHTPYRAPRRYARRFIDRHAATTIGLAFDDVTGAWQGAYGDADKQRIVDLYDGSLAFTDRQIGRLLRGLARRGRLDRTLVIITADHGEEFWDHRQFFHGQSLYDELLHVPLLVRLPTVGHGRVVEQVVSTVDILPTIADVMGRPVSASDGRSLQPLATGDVERSAEARAVFALVSHAAPRTPEVQAVRTQTMKLIRNVSNGHLEVYDLISDPKEKRNLGPAAPGAAALQQRLDHFRAPLDDRGYQLRLRAQHPTRVRYAIDVTSDPPVPLIAIDRLTLEPDETIVFEQRTSAFGVRGTLEPGDEDRLRFDVLAAAGALKLAIRIDGTPAPDGTLRLGAASAPAGAVVNLTDPRLDGTPTSLPPPTAASPAFTAELWRVATSAEHPTPPALDDATRRRLRQLGYVE